MLPTQETIDQLAERIERAFYRRCAAWNRGCSTNRVWSAAAINLWRANQENPELPIDPELYVAAQPIFEVYPDPWSNFTQDEAIRRYAQRIRRIILLLRAELAKEVALADRLIGRGIGISRIVTDRRTRLSDLGRYIIVLRAGRGDLAAYFHDGALEQHRSCPLYRVACSSFLPDGNYPGLDPAMRRESLVFSMNHGVCNALAN